MFQSLKINSLSLNNVAQVQIYALFKYACWAFILFFSLFLYNHIQLWWKFCATLFAQLLSVQLLFIFETHQASFQSRFSFPTAGV